MNPYGPDHNGFFGSFGGAYAPELLRPMLEELDEAQERYLKDASFLEERDRLLQDLVGRPTPLFEAERLSKAYGARIFLKREDLAHTGAHKINNAIGQALLAERMGKTRIIAETGAGQHGIATATAAASRGLPCTVYMGATDMERQAPNVERIRLHGAEVIPVHGGNKTLKDATNEAIRDWIAHPEDTHYLLGSAIGPHPYPTLVGELQRVIGDEVQEQLEAKTGTPEPDRILANVGGGSNAAGIFLPFLGSEKVELLAAEAAGDGGKHTAASLSEGSPGVLHGTRTVLLQDADGQIQEPWSVSAGLDYPGIGPLHAGLREEGRARYLPVTDDEALEHGKKLARDEGIFPALESAHGLALLEKDPPSSGSVVVINISGRGEKDLANYLNPPRPQQVDVEKTKEA
jgi:tryptophan synthase beta chain